jgi:hypothetical protein
MSTPQDPSEKYPQRPVAITEDHWNQLNARLEHLVLVADQTAQRVEGFDDRIARVENVEKTLSATASSLSKTSRELSGAMMRLTVARLAPAPVLVLVAVLAGVVGGFAGGAAIRYVDQGRAHPTTPESP